MRIEGALSTWSDDRASGFITPAEGGDEVFVHIKAFGRTAAPPQVGQRLSFEVTVTWEGRLRARHVKAVPALKPATPVARVLLWAGVLAALLAGAWGSGVFSRL